MNSFAPNFDKFTPAQRHVWPSLAPLADEGFVLYGGMGLSVRLGHRGSIDFDFFSDRPIPYPTIFERLPMLKNALTLQNERQTLTVSFPVDREDVKLSFFGDLAMKRIGEPQMTNDRVCQVAAIEDLAATKLSAVLNRVQASDYRDVIAIVKSGFSLERSIAGTRALYGTSFQPSDILKALVYFQGGNLDDLSERERNTLREIVSRVRTIPECHAVASVLGTPPAEIEHAPPRRSGPSL